MKYIWEGIVYNLKGLKFSMINRSLFLLGLTRFFILFLITGILLTSTISFFNSIMNYLWIQPQNGILLLLWYFFSIIVGLIIAAISIIVAFIISQFFFSILIMDIMSQITEKKITGIREQSRHMPWYSTFLFLIKQEIPRAIIPLFISLLIMIIGWLTPLGPVVSFLLMLTSAIFLAWDNTDLTPARRMESFKIRFSFLRKNWLFHLGFGLWFLIPFLNIIFISYAPVGATLYYLNKSKR